MQHQGTKTLKTERLTLRPFTLSDASDMYNNWASDPEVTRYLTWPTHTSEEVSQFILQSWIANYKKPDFYNWAIEIDGAVIGNISIVRHDEQSEWGDIGYCIGRKYWGKGITTEAVKTVIDYLFRTVGFHRLGIDHASKNPASGKVAQKCGFTKEGLSRQSFKSLSGEYFDIVHYGLLKSDWEKS